MIDPYGPTAYDFHVCCYCDRALDLDTRVCTCGEYKGIMTVEYWEQYLGMVWS